MQRRLQIALLGGGAGIVGASIVLLPLLIAFVSGELLMEWADGRSLASLTGEALARNVWLLFVALIFAIPVTLVFVVLQRKDFRKWYRELSERKQQILADCTIGLVGGMPSGMMSVRMGLRPEKLPTEILVVSLSGLLLGFLCGFILVYWAFDKPRLRLVGFFVAIGFTAALGECGSVLTGVFIAFALLSLFLPFTSK